VLGVFETEKSWALNDAGIRFALLAVWQIKHAGQLDAFAIEIHLFGTHHLLPSF